MRGVLQAILFVLLAVASGASLPAHAQLVMDVGRERPGADLFIFEFTKGAPDVAASACRGACDERAACRAWTLLPAAPGGGLCRLKSSAEPAVPKAGAVSGVKPTAPVLGTEAAHRAGFEFGGPVIRRLYLEGGDAESYFCEYLCLVETGLEKCLAWTHLRPSPHERRSVCALLSAPGDARPCAECVSGSTN